MSRARVSTDRLPDWAGGRHVKRYTDAKGRDWYFDFQAADRAVSWVQTFCRNSVGEWAGKRVKLLPWQKRIIRKLFGWKRENGLRRYRKLWCEVPRKNGKSTFAAALAKLLAWADDEFGAQVYCIAGNEDQARVVFNECAKMAQLEPAFDGRLEVLKNVIFAPAQHSVIKVLTGRASGKHGLNPHGVIGDEVHEWQHREQYDAMQTAVGARRQPLQIYITTAGASRKTLCYDLHKTAMSIKKGLFDLPDWLVVIYAAEPDDDWTDEAVWRKANPSYGVIIKPEFMRDECEAARANPAQESAFRRLYLNQWTDALTRWLPSKTWEALGSSASGAERRARAEMMRGQRCYLGLDLARLGDLSALALLFPPNERRAHWFLQCRFWCPGDDILERSREQRAPYDVWQRDGWITGTPGNVTDFGFIEAEILDIAARYDVQSLGYDRTFAGEIVHNLAEAGLPLMQVPQTFLHLGNPTAEFARKVTGGTMRHEDNPVLNWNMENVVISTDSAGNQKPDKARSSEKIDGVAAAINALAVAINEGPQKVNDLERYGLEVYG